MKKIACLIAILLLLAEAIITGCATAQRTKTTLIKDNLPILQGRWEGPAVFGVGARTTLILDIYNDSLPLRGKIFIQNIPEDAANIFPDGFEGSGWESYFDTGTISDKGTLIITGRGGNFGEFTLVEGKSKDSLIEGKSKSSQHSLIEAESELDGWFSLWGAKGTATLNRRAR
ncbi:MAG TPA: hypothetical protein VMV04_02280 [Thermodesulfobacteriota bacterium]|nr:hypothetical protein [Thermodesulfobacteriota bacterium]